MFPTNDIIPRPGFPRYRFHSGHCALLEPPCQVIAAWKGRAGPPGSVSAAANVPTELSRPLTSALRAHLSCADPGVERHAHVRSGLGLSRSIRRRISANSARGTATSASWNTT